MNGPLTRRDVLRGGRDLGSLLALSALVGGDTPLAEGALEAAQRQSGTMPDVYGSIGVKPLINARGTFTIISGSLMLPEVRAAMDSASRQYVHLDELSEAIGSRLATLTGAEWGLVTSGCSAALTHATAACVAGGNPDLHVRMPNLAGFTKDEVIIPKHSRNVYDAAVRAVGVRVVEANTLAELESAFGPRTAMVYILAGPRAENGDLSTKSIAALARAKSVPVLVDAAAEVLTIPNVHLQNGATLVAYSGGKCLRGPQAAGLLLGRKDLVRASWVHSAPHHGFARAMKVGKEEAMGMLAAVEAWVKRDHDAEWKQWMANLDHIARRVQAIPGVTTSVNEPTGLSNRTPSLRIWWQRDRVGLSGDEVSRTLFDTEPRIAMPVARNAQDPTLTGVSVTAYMMSPGDERIIADRLHAILSAPARRSQESAAAAPAADLTGQWEVKIDFAAASSTHTFYIRQRGNQLDGAHRGDFVARDLNGTVDGEGVTIRSNYGEQNGDSLSFTFTGKVAGDALSGALDMGEYLRATWTARRRG